MPLSSKLHNDELLSAVSVKYQNVGYIADKVFPEVPVVKTSDKYRIYARNFRLPQTKVANKGLSNEHQFDVSTATYNLQKHGLRDLISDDEEDNYDQASLRRDTTEELTDKILLRKEKSIADLFTSTNWSLGVSLAATAAWSSNSTASNPIPLMDTAATTILNNSGFLRNFAIIPHVSKVNAKNHTSIADRVKYTSAEITDNTLKGLFDLQELLVPTAQIDTAAEGIADSIGDVWPDIVFVGYKPPRASPKAPSCGYTFTKKGKFYVTRYREEGREGEWIDVKSHYDQKIVASLTGYLIKDVV